MLGCCDLGILCLYNLVKAKQEISQIAFYALCHNLVCLDLCQLLPCSTFPTLSLQHKGLILSIIKDIFSPGTATGPLQNDAFERIKHFYQTEGVGIMASVSGNSLDGTVNHSLDAISLQVDCPGSMATMLRECANDVKSNEMCADFSNEIEGKSNVLSHTVKSILFSKASRDSFLPHELKCLAPL
jgi:hypothetical protein